MSEDLVQAGRWPIGIDNVTDETTLSPKALRDAVNVDLNRAGQIRRRNGFRLLSTGSFHSLYDRSTWPFVFCVKDGVLTALRIEADQATDMIPLTTVGNQRMHFTEHAGRLYYANGEHQGWIDAGLGLHPWGIPAPTEDFDLSVGAGGGFPAGDYQVAFTFVMLDGEESPPTGARSVSLTADGTIVATWSFISPAACRAIRIYRSQQNGDGLYMAQDVAPAATTAVLAQGAELGKLLETQNAYPVEPKGKLCSHGSRIYWVDGDRVGYTLPYRPGLWRPQDCFFWFDTDVAMLEAVDAALYVGTQNQILYLKGYDPSQTALTRVRQAGAIPGTSQVVPGSSFGVKSYQGPSVMFWDTAGVCCAADNAGQVLGLTEGRVSLPEYVEGATLYRELNGIKQVITTMLRGGSSAGFAARDVAVAEVIRNGIVIPE